ncbi:right-handed parallel beta-helix repeat-containing protein [Catenulispora sp. NL8]|uniref:Right-handed parallel beta-helix repeat-containing protein n=1 Tax=Catenulispora pinistramenti TaxID=2705254 RepID=A0ABS5KPX3_9ACTN|nr:right-handed parallel beta-helix repeat-containing protein [Catenulispora pinistramenti]MBS2548087.1 right-handed parallel beta-helix repeat-containing protein [Catenulispora pinistramenti]
MKPPALALAALCALGPAAVLLSATAHAAGTSTYYVAANGSDSAAGTEGAPFATIQHAITALSSSGGGAVVVRGGTYAQRISLHGVTDITVTAAPGEHPVLDGSKLAVPTGGRSAMVDIADSTSVTVHGLDITGYRTSDITAMPIGIYVHGGDAGVTVSGNHVHAMGNDNGTLGSMEMNAHGIAAYGDNPKRSISTLNIADNEVDHLVLGASESVVVNGNVDGWRITGNRIHDDNNIGIDAIGYEQTLPPAYRYTDLNRARNGVISGNVVENIKSAGNPAYWSASGWCNCADGLYVDGGTRIAITGNTAHADDIGIEVAAENARGAADHVNVDHNTVTESRYVGITTGGYCDGQQDCGGVQTGTSSANTFTDNMLRDNNTDHDGSPEFLIQFHESGNTITGNTICAAGPGTLLIGTVARSTSGKGDTVDSNRYSAAAATATTARWGWQAKTYTGFAAYRAATGLDAHSEFSASC